MERMPLCEVTLERLLGRDGDPLRVELEVTRVDSSCAVPEEPADLAGEDGAKLGVRQRCEAAERRDARGREALLRARPDSGENPGRQGCEERGFPTGWDDRDAAGLAAVGRDLADDLRRRDAERARERRGAANRDLHRAGEAPRACERVEHAAEVEVALV